MFSLRAGIKFGLAGVLAVYGALALRLGEPTWALFTVFVLMIAPYVGAIAEKSILRAIGTIVGGILGYLLLGSLQQEPLLFLPAVGLLIAVAAAMFGQTHYPYAFLLAGLTATVVIANGLEAPDLSWQIALVRIEEILVGILATMLVSTLVWPRYARVEFREKTRAAFADLAACFDDSRMSLSQGLDPEVRQRVNEFPLRLAGLRTLLTYGTRESRYFRQRVAIYSEIVSTISRIAGSIRTLGEPLPPDPFYHDKIQPELTRLHAALSDALHALATPFEVDHAPLSAELHTAFQAFESRIQSLRTHPGARNISSAEALVFGVHALALHEIHQHILHVHELIEELSSPPAKTKRPSTSFTAGSFIPSLFWIRNGVKGGIAVVGSLVLVDWLQPPGGSVVVLGTFVFTVLNPVSPRGQGDRHAFHSLAICSLMVAVVSVSFLLIAPLLSSYAVLNVALFAALLVWGATFPAGGGIPLSHQIAMLLTVSALGLDAQHPVTFAAITHIFIGITFALLISATVQRVLWPALPQRSVRDRLAEYLVHCERLVAVGTDSVPLADRIRMALIPAEARKFLTALGDSPRNADDVTRFTDYLEDLRRVATELFASAGRLPTILPEDLAAEGVPVIKEFDAALRDTLRHHHEVLTGHSAASPDQTLSQLLPAWRDWSLRLRLWVIDHDAAVPDALRLLGYAGRYEQAARDLLTATDHLQAIDIQRATADHSL